MADFHKYKFHYAGNAEYAEGYDRIFGKRSDDKSEVQDVLPKGKRTKSRRPGNKARRGKQQVPQVP